MKNLTITILCFLYLTGCSKDELVTEYNGVSINGVWVLESFEDLLTNEVTIRTEENSWGFDVRITFDDDIEPHHMAGKVTTNAVFGEFDYVSANTVELKNLGSTFVNQPEWGNKFVQAMLTDVLEYEVTNMHLVIYYDDHQKKLTMRSDLASVCLEKVPTNEACRAYFERWFYNPKSNACEKISYSGCSQKGFRTEVECQNCKCK